VRLIQRGLGTRSQRERGVALSRCCRCCLCCRCCRHLVTSLGSFRVPSEHELGPCREGSPCLGSPWVHPWPCGVSAGEHWGNDPPGWWCPSAPRQPWTRGRGWLCPPALHPRVLTVSLYALPVTLGHSATAAHWLLQGGERRGPRPRPCIYFRSHQSLVWPGRADCSSSGEGFEPTTLTHSDQSQGQPPVTATSHSH